MVGMYKPTPNLFNNKFLRHSVARGVNYQATKKHKSDYPAILLKWQNLVDIGKFTEIQKDAEFVRDIFGDILEYNVDIHYKRQTSTDLNSEKCDALLGFFDNQAESPIAVLEMKSPSVDLNDDRIVKQAFDYAGAFKGVKFVILCNFKEFRLFDAAFRGEYHAIKLADMVELDNDDTITRRIKYDKFNEFYTIFARENLLGASPLVPSPLAILYAESKQKKQDIQDEFFNEYKIFRERYLNDILSNNPNILVDSALQIAQKMLNRLIFIRFCEQKKLIKNTLEMVKNTAYFNKDINQLLQKLFQAINYGYKGYNGHNAEIPKFNGGLFEDDPIFDTTQIDYIINLDFLKKLTEYDFENDISEEILGHIFEKSLPHIDELKQKYSGQNNNKPATGKQKAEGVYYTPNLITRYMVKRSLGMVLEQWKINFDITNYTINPLLAGKNPKQAPLNPNAQIIKNLYQYANALNNITILDPACGSGAFLIEVLAFLKAEWDWVYSELARCGEMVLPNIIQDKYHEILQKNIYGLDCNVQSVEITKLSLWLKIANAHSPLTNLDNNIKCGDSVKNVDWGKFFGLKHFDIIIGNPPYIKEDVNRAIFEPHQASPYYQGKMDFWQFFACIGLDNLQEDGFLAYIAPNNWTTNHGASIMRQKIIQNHQLCEFIDLHTNKIFESAEIQTMIMLVGCKKHPNGYVKYRQLPHIKGDNYKDSLEKIKNELEINNFTNIDLSQMDNQVNTIHFTNQDENEIINKIIGAGNYSIPVNDCVNGIHHHHDVVPAKNHDNKQFIKGDGIFSLSFAEIKKLKLNPNELALLKPEYYPKQINRYLANNNNERMIIYTNSSFKNPDSMNNYPNLKKHLDKYQPIITSDNKPYGLNRPKEERFFKGEKIISLRKCTIRPRFSFVEFDSFVSAMYYIIQPGDINLAYLTGLLNSSLIAYYFKKRGKMQGNNYQIDKEPLMHTPLMRPDNATQERIGQMVRLLQQKNLENMTETAKTGQYLHEKLQPTKPKCWYKYSWKEIFKSRGKDCDLTPNDEKPFFEFWQNEKNAMNQRIAQLMELEQAIDNEIFALYGINEQMRQTIYGEVDKFDYTAS